MIIGFDNGKKIIYYNAAITLPEFLEMIIHHPEQVEPFLADQPSGVWWDEDVYWLTYYPDKLELGLNELYEFKEWPLEGLKEHKEEILKAEKEFKEKYDEFMKEKSFKVYFKVTGCTTVLARDESEARLKVFDQLTEANAKKEYRFVEVDIRDTELEPESAKE